MKTFASAVAFAACTLATNALAFKSDSCIDLIHDSIGQQQRILSGPHQKLSDAVDQTKVSRRSVQFYEASLLLESISHIGVRLQLLSITSALAQEVQHDKQRFGAALTGLDDLSQSTIQLISLKARLAELTMPDITDRQLRAAGLDVTAAFQKLNSVYSQCAKP